MVPSLVFDPSLTPDVVLAMVIVGAVPSYVHVYVLEAAELVLDAASPNLSAATNTLGVPSLVAVHVAVYVAPDPERLPRLQPETVMSPAMKLVVASLDVKVSAIAAVLVDEPLFTVDEVIAMVGTVVSYVHV